MRYIELEKKRRCDTCGSNCCSINSSCSKEWKLLLNDYKSTRLYKPNTYIFEAGEKVEGIFAVYDGKVKELYMQDNEEIILRLVSGGELLGYRGLAQNDMKYNISAKTFTETEISFFPNEIFLLAAKSNSTLSYFLIELFAKELNRVETKMRNYITMTAREKILHTIAYVIRCFGFDSEDPDKLSFTPSKKDISSLSRTTYETVVRVYSDLKKGKIISPIGKELKIIDKDYFSNAFRHSNLQ